MITVKTADNKLTDIAELHIKTSANAMTKIAEGYQVVSVNGARRLIPVFLSECKHNYVISDELSYGASCTEDGLNVYVCTKCGESYSETGESAYGHNYVDGFCENCGDCLYHGEETVCVEINSWYHAVVCSHCGAEIATEGHGVSDYVSNGGSHYAVCACGMQYDAEPCEDDGTGKCSVCYGLL